VDDPTSGVDSSSVLEDSGGVENKSDSERERRQSGQLELLRCRVFRIHSRQKI
jgi:hypothetical protein